MSKCIRCGGSFLTRRRIKLKDAEICGKCFQELGFDKSYYLISQQYAYDDIKDGLSMYYANKQKEAAIDEIIAAKPIRFADYGQERERIATEGELAMFGILKKMVNDPNLKLIQKSDQYVSVVLGEYDLARIKYTPRAKWIVFPLSERRSEKLRIDSPGDVAQFSDLVRSSLDTIEKFL